MKTLVWDTETGGFPDDRLPDEHPSQPRIVQLAAILHDAEWVEQAIINVIIRHEGYVIPEQATRVHGITTEMMMDLGIRPRVAMLMFGDLLWASDEHGGHNIEYDEILMRIARAQIPNLDALPYPAARFCTADLSDPILKLPPTEKMIAAGRGNQTKRPSLGEAYQFFTGTALVGAHSGLADARGSALVLRHCRAHGGS